MTLPDLVTLKENLEFGLDSFRSLPRPAEPDIAWADACLLAWQRSRQLGITLLLAEADGAAFRAHLAAAGEIRRDLLLSTASRPEAFAEYRRAGDLGGFADALVAGRLDLAREVAGACADAWARDHEYEDDFLYAKILHALVTGGFAVDDASLRLLEPLRAAAEGEPTGQVLVASALLAADEEAFVDALATRVDEFRAWWARKGEGIVEDPDAYACERHVFVEGLALKAIARGMGIPVVDEEPLMPREALDEASTA